MAEEKTSSASLSARAVVERAAEAIRAFVEGTKAGRKLEEFAITENVSRAFRDDFVALAHSGIALRTLLAQPPSDTVARLVEAAERATRFLELYLPARDDDVRVKLEAAIAAHRASVDALGGRSVQADPCGLNAQSFVYTNHKGNTRKRTIKPMRLWWGATQWHVTDQWIIDAWDVEKGAMRSFALKNFGEPRTSLARDEWRDICGVLRAAKEPVAERADDGTIGMPNVIRRILRERDHAIAERNEARKERDAAFERRDEAAASLSRSDGLLRIAEKERDEAWARRDAEQHKRTAAEQATRDATAAREAARKERDALRVELGRMLAGDGGDAGRIAALAAERDSLKVEVGWRRKLDQENREVSDVVRPLGSESIMAAIKRTVAERDALKAEARVRAEEAARDLDSHRAFRWGVEWGREGYRSVMARFKYNADAQRFRGVTSGLRAQVVDLKPTTVVEDVHVAAAPEAVDEVNADKITPPSPAPLDPRAALIAKGAIRLAAARYGIDKGDTGTEEWALAMASGLLRAAEAEARKGVAERAEKETPHAPK